jgi:hypothetical protein
MSTSHHAEIFLQARRGVDSCCAKMHHANNKRCIFHYGYRETAASSAPPVDGAATSRNEPDVLIFQSNDQKKG